MGVKSVKNLLILMVSLTPTLALPLKWGGDCDVEVIESVETWQR